MKLSRVIRACHPEPTVTVTLVAALLAAASSRPAWQVALVTLAVVCGQLSVGWSNDFIDADRDAAIGRDDKPIAAGTLSRQQVKVLAIIALVLAIVLSLCLGTVGWLHVVALGSAWSYNYPLKNTAVSVVPFALSFGLLVPFAYPAAAWQLIIVGALLGAAAHFANALPDLADDAKTGIRGLPHRLGRNGSHLVTVALLLAASGVIATVMIAGVWLTIAAAVWLAVASVAKMHGFRVVQLVALVDVVALLASAYLQ